MTYGRWILPAAGFTSAAAVSAYYAGFGYAPALVWLLAAAIAATALTLRPSSAQPTQSITRADIAAAAFLLLVMAPLYWRALYTTPWQVNTDEVAIMESAIAMSRNRKTDLFSVSSYFGFPSAIFVLYGKLADLLGGVGLYNSRLVHSSFGVACVLLAFAFFRQFLETLRAATLALLLGANHALVAISRMAMRENSSLFFELGALWLIASGLNRGSRSRIFLGGVSAGLGFYGYFPGRIAFVIAATVFLTLTAIAGLQRRHFSRTAALFLLFIGGWGVVAAPVIISSVKNPQLALGYARQQVLIYPEGRKLQQEWLQASSPESAWRRNIGNGLAMFNTRRHDQGYIYPNYGHGFVDPVTGVLLWTGFALALRRLWRNRMRITPGKAERNYLRALTPVGDLIAILGFLAIYLSSSFFLTKAPNYTRLLVVLPFVTYLAGTALWSAAGFAARLGRRRVERRNLTRVIAVAGAAAIAVLNVTMFGDFVSAGRANGNDVGSTARYVEARKNRAGHTWVVAADSANQYYSWGNVWQWRAWSGFFAGARQTTQVTSLAELPSLKPQGDFTVFISAAAWRMAEPSFQRVNRNYAVTPLTPRHLAIEVARRKEGKIP